MVNTHETADIKASKSAIRQVHRRLFGIIIKAFLCLLVLVAGGAIAYAIATTGKKPQIRPPAISVPMVQTEKVRRSDEQAVVQVMGTVVPARQVTLKSKVAGEVKWVNPEFMVGGFLKKGEKVLNIDPEDFLLAIAQSQAEVANARYALKVEQGYQEVARAEWNLLNGEEKDHEQDSELALRKPHLEKAEAEMVAAEAGLKEARLSLSRTIMKSPFNAVVRSKEVDIGSQISTQDQIAELVGTDAFWVQASIPVDRLKWIAIPQKADEKGSKVRVLSGRGSENEKGYEGEVIKLLPDLETQGRMARILVEVRDPLCLEKDHNGRRPLLIDEFVQLEIEGKILKDVVRIPRTVLRDDSQVWVVGEGKALQFRTVDILWREEKTVFIGDGIKNNDDLIVSNLQSPVEGMQIRIQGDEASLKGDHQGSPKTFPINPLFEEVPR
ncbi:MAG: efflux RND transporter periplasmic adaptor subunit [Deltaproteobacteria bacterium]|nr:efflux RND transporter periplasmic adaptor subunit [Deltaproteobacteria bacterium]